MAAIRAPRYDMSLPPTKSRTFAAGAGPVALDAQGTGMPNFAALRVMLLGVAGGSVTLTHEDTTTLTYTVGANSAPIYVDGPIRAIATNVGTIVTAYWWAEPGLPSRDPQYFNARLP